MGAVNVVKKKKQGYQSRGLFFFFFFSSKTWCVFLKHVENLPMKNFRLHEQKFQPALCHEVMGLESSGFMTSKEQAQTCPTAENTFCMKILVTRTKLVLRLAA